MDELKDRLRPMEDLHMPDRWEDIERRRPGPQLEEQEATWRRVAVVVVAFAIAAGAIALAVSALSEHPDRPGASPTLAPPPALNGVITYSASEGPRGSFFTINPDGTGTRAIVIPDAPEGVLHAAWSPDGTRIAFDARSGEGSGAGGGDRDIYVVNADGSGLARLTPADGWDYLPTWSPDGTSIAFVHNTVGNDDVWVMDSNGDHPRGLTDDPGLDLAPSWSPDGEGLAFISDRDGSLGIYTMRADGTRLVRLTHDDAYYGQPEWSPDGRSLAFASDRDGPGLYVMDGDGGNAVKVAPSLQAGPVEGSWSPDGTAIAFVSSQGTVEAPVLTLQVLDVMSGSTTTIVSGNGICCPVWSSQDPSSTSSASPPPPTPTEVTSDIETIGGVSPFPDAVAVGEGGVWVSAPRNDGSGGGDVVRFDPVTADIVARIPINHLPSWESGGGGLAAGAGSVWAMGIDRVDGQVHAILTRIDPSENAVVDEIDLGPGRTGDVWAADGAVWVVQFTGEPNTLEVVRLDPTDGRILARIPIPGEWSAEIFAFVDSVWVSALTTGTDGAFGGPGSQHLLIHIDAATNRYIGQFSCTCAPFLSPSGGVFYASTEHGLQRYDALSGEEIGGPFTTSASTGRSVGDERGGLWTYQTERNQGDLVFEHLDRDGVVVASGSIGGQEREAWVGIARAFDPTTDSLWIVHYKDSVSVIRIR